jgi:sugar lactone lactonase YvrE
LKGVMKINSPSIGLVVGVLMTLQSFGQNTTESYAFRTLAGAPPGGVPVDGTGSAARFNGMNSVTVDADGNVYTAEYLSHSIRKISPSGEVTTLAGIASTPGSNDGKGAGARFNGTYGVTMDRTNSIIVADTFNHSIRRITKDGVVTRIVGNPLDGRTVNGLGNAARFYLPTSVGVDGAGNIYVAEPGSHVIRKVTPGLAVTTLAGLAGVNGSVNGVGGAARFYSPYGLAVTVEGVVYVADKDNHTIRRISTDGTVTTLAGLAGTSGSSDGVGSTARFFNPYGVAVDQAGNVYVGDRDNHAIRKISPDGRVRTVAGKSGVSGSVDGRGSAARFNKPCGLVVTGSGAMFVADLLNNTVRESIPLSMLGARRSGDSVAFGLGTLEGETVVIEESSDLSTWTPNSTNIWSSASMFTEAMAGAVRAKFFRVRVP